MINVTKVLSKLGDVNQLSHYEWIARCPVHGDNGRSLHLKAFSEHIVVIEDCCSSAHQLDESNGDKKILKMGKIYCLHGCSVHSIVEALNFEDSELYPWHDQCSRIRESFHSVFDESELLDGIRYLIKDIPSTDQIAKFPKSGRQYENAVGALKTLNQMSITALMFLRNELRSSEFPWDSRYGRFDWPYKDRLNSKGMEW